MILLTGADERLGASELASTQSAEAAERVLERRPVDRGLGKGRPEGIPTPDPGQPEETPGNGPPEQTPGNGPPTEGPDEPETPDTDAPEQTPEDTDTTPETPPEQTPEDTDTTPEAPPEQSPGNGNGPPAEQPDEPDAPEQTPEDTDTTPETPPEQSPGNGNGSPAQPPAARPDEPEPPDSDTPGQRADTDTTSRERGPRERRPAIDSQPLEQPSDPQGRDDGESTGGDRGPDGGANTPPSAGSSGSASLTGRASSSSQGSALPENAIRNVAPAGSPRGTASVWDDLAAMPAGSARGSTDEEDPSPRPAGDDDVITRSGSESSSEQDISVEPDTPVDDDPGGSAAGPETDQGDESNESQFAGQAFAPPEDAEGVAVWLLALSLLAFVVLTGAVIVQRGQLAEAVAGFVPVGRSRTPKKAESRPDNLRSRFSPGSGATISSPSAGSTSTAPFRPAPAESALPPAAPPTAPDARQEAPSPAPEPREAEPSAAPDTPPSPPSEVVAGWTARIADEMQVDRTTLYAAAAAVERRQALTGGLDRATAADARLESRLASVLLCLMPASAGVALVALGDKTTLSALLLSGVAIILAAALTFRGYRWVRRLPDTQPRVSGGFARSLDDDADRIDESLAAVDQAVLYAAAGQGGLEALRLAAPDDPTHPVRNALTQPGGAQPPVTEIDRALVRLVRAFGRTSNSADAATLLDWASERLHATRQADLRERLLLLRVRALGPFFLCYLPAGALLIIPLVL